MLVRVDPSPHGAVFSWEGFDRILKPPECSLATAGEYVAFVTASTQGDALWMPCADLEIRLLTDFGAEETKILAPLHASRKGLLSRHRNDAAEILGLSRPKRTEGPCTDRDAHHFLSNAGWQAWLKSGNHGMLPCRSWQEYRSSRLSLDQIQGTSADWFLEESISGIRESLSFSAHAGILLDACALFRTQTTAGGKSRGGKVLKLDPETWSRVRELCEAFGWTGGGGLECVRHPSGRLYLLEVNPGFPSWIHGGTLAGHNLPALLVSAAFGVEAPPGSARSLSFVQLVMEVPCRTEVTAGDPKPSDPPFGTPSPPRVPDERALVADAEADPVVPAALIDTFRNGHRATPFYWLDRNAVPGNLAAAKENLTGAVGRHGRVHVAYSCKTNPDFELLKRVAAAGWLVDTISAHEIERCLQAGFDPHRLILNGPAKFWPAEIAGRLPRHKYFAVNCDSRVELARVCESLARREYATSHLGLRIRPSHTPSRFGLPSDARTMDEVADDLRGLPALPVLALHFHFSPWFLGFDWFREVETLSRWASQISRRIPSAAIEMFDFGGGFSERQLADEAFLAALEQCASGLAGLGITDFVFELGRSVVQSHGSYVSRVIEVRTVAGTVEVVCDGAITNIGDNYSHPKSIAFVSGTSHAPLASRHSSASGILLGRTCMEGDILKTGFGVPEGLQAGDYVVIGDCGAYDISMAQQFGLGENSGAVVA